MDSSSKDVRFLSDPKPYQIKFDCVIYKYIGSKQIKNQVTVSQHSDWQRVITASVAMDEQDGFVRRVPGALSEPVFTE